MIDKHTTIDVYKYVLKMKQPVAIFDNKVSVRSWYSGIWSVLENGKWKLWGS